MSEVKASELLVTKYKTYLFDKEEQITNLTASLAEKDKEISQLKKDNEELKVMFSGKTFFYPVCNEGARQFDVTNCDLKIEEDSE